jgi:hypothetical protein
MALLLCRVGRTASVAAIAVHGWGPVGGSDIMDACLLSVLGEPDLFQLYSVLGVSREVLLAQQQQSSASLVWNWVVLVRDKSPSVVAAGVEACAGGLFLDLRLSVLVGLTDRQIQVASSCGGRHWEWNGDSNAEGCVCVGGYEEVNTVLYGRHCIPCPNGTYRARYDPGECTPCRAELFEVGTYLGMSECACLRGYARDKRTWSCQPEPGGGRDIGAGPSQIGALLTAHFTAVLLVGIGAGAAALMFSAVLVCLF